MEKEKLQKLKEELDEELKNNPILKAIEDEYLQEVRRDKDSDSEEIDIEIEREMKPIAEHIENVSWKQEMNGDVEMKDEINQNKALISDALYLGGFPAHNSIFKLASLQADIDLEEKTDDLRSIMLKQLA